ncbi:hypothetical protein [Reichenbachiella versicolor]|uniref:hypothetical protein n=1 Tax=Reichenbachiella versicolor TaxID=1821036 RepID=UPI000D6EAFF8|nr:hypothetical protein [Reichenbachiella versicolor]
MRQFLFSVVFVPFFLFNSLFVFSQEDPTILEIRKKYKIWQPILGSGLNGATQLFHYAWRDNFQNNDWYLEELTSEDKFLFQKVNLIEKANLGTFVNCYNFSISADWTIVADYYFGQNNKLYFIFWRMNTFRAEEPLTIEKRLYFDSKGDLIRNLISVYKMNTKEKSTASFDDQEVEYHPDLTKMGFYDKWKSK